MGGVRTGIHARDMLMAGATMVAVGTESFRDPLAGARIAAELRRIDAKTGMFPAAPDQPRAPIAQRP
jgi:dihydroorotate dehydrogenase